MGRRIRARGRHRAVARLGSDRRRRVALGVLRQPPVALVAGVAARRVVPESIVGGPVPDLVGVGLLSAAVAALALAITQGGDWGWSSARVVGSFTAATVLAPIAIRRSTRHKAPAIDLDVFRSRTVVLANAATFLYSVGFFGMLLANVLFLTSVWDYSTLQAGLAITPGPLLVAALSGPSGRLAARVGYGPVLVAGGLTFATGLLFYVTVVDIEASYLTHWLPGALLVGVGVALSFPVLSAAAVADLPRNASAPAAPSTRPPARSEPCSVSPCSSPSSAPPPHSTRPWTASASRGWSAPAPPSAPPPSPRSTADQRRPR